MDRSPFKSRTRTHFDGYSTADNNNNDRMAGSGDLSLNPVSVAPLRAVPALMHARENIPRALIIESLIKLLCRKYEPNPVKGRHLFKAICKILHRSQFLDQTLLFHELKATRKHFTVNFDRLFTSVRDSLPNENLAQDLLLSVGTFVQNFQIFENEAGSSEVSIHNSQYLLEFEEECCIGKGGFGRVYKAKKKVDQHFYAVKKIPFSHIDDPLFHKIRREVMLFAKLCHSNIVSYKTAWIEQGGADILLNITGSSEESEVSEENGRQRCDDNSISNDTSSWNGRDTGETLDEVEFLAEDTSESVFSASRTFVHKTTRLKRSVSVRHENNNVCDEPEDQIICSVPAVQRLRTKSISDPSGDSCKALCTLKKGIETKIIKSVLFVQMELCQENLHDWLEERVAQNAKAVNEVFDDVNEQEAMTIFKQILEGVAYLHEHDLVHRDLKPQNIMFDENRVAKIGDFGLATVCSKCDPDNRRPWVEGHTEGVGTSLYAAPEQRDKSNYDSKADMYSLGVILFELFVPFYTQMERRKVLEDLAKGIISEEIRQKYPKQMETVLQLIKESPSERPTAVEILNSTIFLSKDQLIKQLTFENVEMKRRLLECNKKLLERDKEIKKLKCMLDRK